MKLYLLLLIHVFLLSNVGCKKSETKKENQKSIEIKKTLYEAPELFTALYPLPEKDLVEKFKNSPISVRGKIAILSTMGNDGVQISLKAGDKKKFIHLTFADKGKEALEKKISSGQTITVENCTLAGKSSDKVVGKIWESLKLNNCKLK